MADNDSNVQNVEDVFGQHDDMFEHFREQGYPAPPPPPFPPPAPGDIPFPDGRPAPIPPVPNPPVHHLMPPHRHPAPPPLPYRNPNDPYAHMGDIDNIARQYIEEQGYGAYFNHSLGHGVGIDVHELPVLKPKGDILLEDNMIFTIEPGIYLPDKFGVRLEQTVLINNGKPEIISSALDKYVYDIIE